jgi:hypothetical protein
MGGAPDVNLVSPVAAGIRIQTSVYGKPIALAYGQPRLSGNLVWYNDFTPIAHTSTQSSGGKGGGGGSTSQTTWTYTVAGILALCEGPIGGVPAVWADKARSTPAALGLSVYVGSTSQTAFPWVVTKHPTEALNYRGLATVDTAAYDLGENPSLPNHSFEVQALLPFSGTIVDANPADVLPDFLTHLSHGAGYPPAWLGSLTQFSNYCVASGIFISPAYFEQEPAATSITRLAQIANSALVYSEGVLKVFPYGDAAVSGNGATYTPNTTPVYALTDDDFLDDSGADPVIVLRGSPADAFNQVQVQFNNRANSYNQEVATAKDQANIEIYGLRPMPPLTMNEICTASTARAVAQLILQRALYIRNTYRFRLGWKYCLLEPMDIVTLTESSGDGLVAVPVRITVVEEDEFGTLAFEAEDYLDAVASHVAYPTQPAGGYSANYNVSPGSTNAPLIFDAPGRLATSGYEIWIALAGSAAAWGGANVWVSTDGDTYAMVGTTHGPSRYGRLSAILNAGSDPDGVNSCAVDMSASGGLLLSGTAADADNLNTLCWVDGELISYQTATLTSANHYNLQTRLRRGVYGTPITAHSTGTSFARIDQGLFRYAYDPAMIGKTIWIKLQSFNFYNAATESLASLAAYSYVIKGPLGALADVTTLSATQEEFGIRLAWAAVSDFDLSGYELRVDGNTWDGATPLAKVKGSNWLWPKPLPALRRVWVKAFDRVGNASLNAASILVVVPYPSSIGSFLIDGDTLSWQAVSDIDLAGYRIRYNYGSINTSWGTANALHAGLLTDTPYTMLTRPAGPAVLMIKSVDNVGNESLDPAIIYTDLGAPLVANVVESYDYHAHAFPGIFTGATIDGGTGDLIANDASGVIWSPDHRVSMWAADAATTMWPGTAWTATSYEFTFAPSSGAIGSGLTLLASIFGTAWSITYRQRGINLMWGGATLPMWSIDDSMWSADSGIAQWRNDTSAMWLISGDMWTAPAYSPWPGSVTAQRDNYDFRIAIDFGITRGRIAALAAQVDVPDRQATLADVAVSAAGTRLAIGAGWYAVTAVNLTLQDSGGSGATVRIMDKNATSGPLVNVFNSAGTAVSGVLDAIVQGY